VTVKNTRKKGGGSFCNEIFTERDLWKPKKSGNRADLEGTSITTGAYPMGERRGKGSRGLKPWDVTECVLPSMTGALEGNRRRKNSENKFYKPVVKGGGWRVRLFELHLHCGAPDASSRKPRRLVIQGETRL